MSIIDRIIKPTVKGKKITSKILDEYNYQITNTINTYKSNLSLAKNGQRQYLYKMYEDILRDNHLSGIIELRKDRVLGTNFNVFNSDGTPYKDSAKFHSKWFYSFMDMALNELYYGFSLIQIDGIIKDNVSSVSQVPFKLVNVETSELYPSMYSYDNGISYNTKLYAKWLVEVVDDVSNLGILSALAPLVLWKRSVMSAWAEYAEVFGMPIRIGKTSSNVETDRKRLAQFLKGLAKSAWAVIDESESIEFIESSHTDAYNIYEKYINLINDEMSKRVLGATQITDSSAGSGYAQSAVHNIQFSSKIKRDLTKLTFTIQDILFPTLVNLGIIPEGLLFKFDTFETMSLTDRITIDEKLNNMKALDEQYLRDTYRVEFNKNTLSNK